MVGARRFELPTPCAQGRCATRLRYAPSSDRSHSTREAYEIKVLRANQPKTAAPRPSSCQRFAAVTHRRFDFALDLTESFTEWRIKKQRIVAKSIRAAERKSDSTFAGLAHRPFLTHSSLRARTAPARRQSAPSAFLPEHFPIRAAAFDYSGRHHPPRRHSVPNKFPARRSRASTSKPESSAKVSKPENSASVRAFLSAFSSNVCAVFDRPSGGLVKIFQRDNSQRKLLPGTPALRQTFPSWWSQLKDQSR